MSSPAVYPSDVSDEEWLFVAPYLCPMKEDAPQREHSLRAVFNALRWMVRAGAPWRLIPTNLPPWQIVHQQTQRRLDAEVFEWVTHVLKMLLRLVAGRHEQPTAAVLDTRRCRRLARDYERLPETLAGLHFVAFACLMLHASWAQTPGWQSEKFRTPSTRPPPASGRNRPRGSSPGSSP